ncbi:MAG TPA: CPBP family intramembrane glutamic endopeptidase [Candidatus Eisenbacteria bacterium]|jgi:membrane protease YdiL (CAAX protease family)
MTTLAAAPESRPAPRLVAPIAHTIALVLLFLAMAVGGGLLQHQAAHSAMLPAPSRPTAVYLYLIAMEWGLVLYVARGGLRRTGTALRDLVGGHWGRPADVARDAALALAAWAVWTLVSWGIDRLAGPDHAASVRSLLPRHPLDVALWVALSMSAGFAEELVFRGYLLVQFRALTHSTALALVMQAALFGVSHGYQGARACATIALFGLLYGALALRSRSLRPGMLAHAWTDIASGIFRI